MAGIYKRLSALIEYGVGTSIAALLWLNYAWRYTLRKGFCTDSTEFGEYAIRYGGVGLLIGLVVTMLWFRSKWYNASKYFLQVMLRYGLAYFFISYALTLLLDVRYPESYASLEYKIADLSSGELVWAFFSYTYGYQSFIGWMQLVGACLLFFRSATPLGMIILGGINLNLLSLGISYRLCHVPEVSIYLVSMLYLFSPYLKNFLNTTLLNRSTKAISFPLFSRFSHGYRASNILKIALVIGIMIYFFNQTTRYNRYYLSNSESPIVGVWKVDSVRYAASGSDDSKLALSQFENIYLDRKRFGSVKAGDSLSTFEYMVDTTFQQLEFWNFHEFRSLDLKGKYSFSGPDTLIYIGNNQKDSIEMKLVLDKSYPKLR